jgi:hypothetical protein
VLAAARCAYARESGPEWCSGDACDTLERETTVYVVEKGEGGGPLISISVLSDGDKDGRAEEQFKRQRVNRF